MDENLELLNYIYKTAEMGSFSLTKLIELLNGKENKIKKTVEEEIKEYEKYLKESKKLIEKNKYELKESGIMAKMGASAGIKKETMMDNSDAAIAHMIIEGLTMGVVDISSKINNYKESAEKKIINLAKDFLKFQEDEIEKLKSFL